MRRESVQSLERARQILDLLCHRERSSGVTECASRLRLAKSTVHRLLAALEQAGFVSRTADGKYRLGLKLWELGCAAVRGLSIREVARPIMEELVRRTGETVHLSVWDQTEVVYIDKVDSPNPIRLHATLGGRAPAHAVASGLALLASQDAAMQGQVLRGPLKAFTECTITSHRQLQRRLEEIRRKGYAFSVGAWYAGSAGVAAPIRSHTGDVVAAISVAGPAERIVSRVPALVRLVCDAAVGVSRALGDPTAQRSLPASLTRHRPARATDGAATRPGRRSSGNGRLVEGHHSRRRP